MLTRKQVAIIFLLALIPFAIYSVVRPDLRGFDSYAYLSQTCGKYTVNDDAIATNLVFSLLPCNILAIKGVLFALFLLSLLGIAHLGQLFHPEKGWLAALFSFLSPSLFFEASKFENDQLAIPLLIWSAYFFYKARKTKDHVNDLYCICLIVIAGAFWQGAVFWLVAFGLSSLLLAVPALIVVAVYWQKLIGNVVPNSNVVEAQPGIGLAMLAGLALGFSTIPRQMIPQAAIFFLLLALQMKFAWFIMPLLSVGIVMFYVNENLDRKRIAREAKGVLLVLAIFLVVAWGIAVQGHSPHPHQWEAVEYAIEQSENGFVQNDWDTGYWILYKGGTPRQVGGGEQHEFGEGIVLTRKEQPDCRLLKEFREMLVYEC